MNADALAEELSDLIATESHGLMRHVAASNPYADEKTYRLRQAIVRIARHTATHVQRITAIMEQLKLDPRARTYSLDVSYHHYDSAAYMFDKLMAEKREQIAAYQRAVEHLGDDSEARAELVALLAENREHLQQLTDVAPGSPTV